MCLVAATGGAYVFILYGGFGRDGNAPPLTLLLAASTLAFFAALAIKVLGRLSGLLISIAFFVGLYAGVVLDVVINTLRGGTERNLFPVEMVVLTVVALPGFVAGIVAGWGINRFRPSAPR
jgi:hypothetical protein